MEGKTSSVEGRTRALETKTVGFKLSPFHLTSSLSISHYTCPSFGFPSCEHETKTHLLELLVKVQIGWFKMVNT